MGEDVQLHERPVARLSAGLPFRPRVGWVQPAVLAIWEPLLFPKLPLRAPRLQPLALRESQPTPEKEPIEVAFEEAPPAEVQALLALLFAQSVPIPRPPLPGEALRAAPQVFPVSLAAPLTQSFAQPLALPGEVVLQKVALRPRSGPSVLRFRSHWVPRGARQVEREIEI